MREELVKALHSQLELPPSALCFLRSFRTDSGGVGIMHTGIDDSDRPVRRGIPSAAISTRPQSLSGARSLLLGIPEFSRDPLRYKGGLYTKLRSRTQPAEGAR